jgi:hypothetical protein
MLALLLLGATDTDVLGVDDGDPDGDMFEVTDVDPLKPILRTEVLSIRGGAPWVGFRFDAKQLHSVQRDTTFIRRGNLIETHTSAPVKVAVIERVKHPRIKVPARPDYTLTEQKSRGRHVPGE